MVATLTSFSSRKYLQTTDGTNDYYVGINGTNGYLIAPFAGINTLTFNILINFPTIVDSTTATKRLLEISNSARTGLYIGGVGDVTGALTNEYVAAVTLIAGVTRSRGTTTVGSISAGWHMITIVTDPGFCDIYIDGVNRGNTTGTFGIPQTVSVGYTADRMALLATTAGGVPLGCTWREAGFINASWLAANALALYNFYTRDGNVPLGNASRSLLKFMITPSARAQVIALYRGNESGTDLLDSISPTTRKLTKTNF